MKAELTLTFEDGTEHTFSATVNEHAGNPGALHRWEDRALYVTSAVNASATRALGLDDYMKRRQREAHRLLLAAGFGKGEGADE